VSEPAAATECAAELRLHDFRDGSMAFLTCDLMLAEHAGLNHHDPVYGTWWGRCTLNEHGHYDAEAQHHSMMVSLPPGVTTVPITTPLTEPGRYIIKIAEDGQSATATRIGD